MSKRSKFRVGQVVIYNDDPYKIASRFKDLGEEYFMLSLHGDYAYDCAKPKDLRKLTKKERGL